MKLKHLTFLGLAKVYYRHLFWDFPPSERRPLYKMKALRDLGRYDAWAMTDERGRTAAYATAAMSDGDILLDYLAVCRGKRGKGHGSEMLRLLAEEFSGKTVFVEVEDPDTAPDENSREERVRRLRFYLRGGFSDSGVRCVVYGVPYAILLAGEKLSTERAKSRLDNIYRNIFSAEAYAGHICFTEDKLL